MFEEYSQDGQSLDFDDFANLLVEAGLHTSPSTLHGGICGVLAGAGASEPDYCLAGMCQALDLEVHGELADYCLRLSAISLQTLDGEDFEFHMFMPDDEVELELRVQAMADWCAGFLSGYAQVISAPDDDALGEETAEILKDIAAMAQARLDEDLEEEEAERSLFDISEYLRFATLNLFLDSQARSEEDVP
jgi:uncharacterized protein YgfB (UPF0149 family)